MTLLRLIRALPERPPGEVVEVGVDDFALRRGHVYGTVIIEINSHRPLDVLPDRTADTLACWLKQHPGVKVICRDRAGAYAEGARAGAPDAIQVADRWHLWHNLAEAVEKTVIAQRGALRTEPETSAGEATAAQQRTTPLATAEPPPAAAVPPVEGRLAARTRERHAAAQRLLEAGRSITAIGRELGLNRRTARRFAHAERVEDLLTTPPRPHGSVLDTFKPYLHDRFNAGHTDAAELTAEITALGFRGSQRTVRRHLQPFRASLTAPPPVPLPPSTRQVTGWLTRRPDNLSEDERLELKKILDRNDILATTHQQVREFAQMLTQRTGEQLSDWLHQVDTTGAPALRSLASGLRTDLSAVTAGLTLEYSSGAVEGTVNRIKMIKRQMFGRAKFDLLRKRILNPA